MARSRKNRRGREVITFANRQVAPRFSRFEPYRQNVFRAQTMRSNLIDDRLWNPQRSSFRRPRTIYGRPAQVVSTFNNRRFSRDRLVFAVPKTVSTCVRRQQRREVLFARGRAGRNGGRRYRRNASSSISC